MESTKIEGGIALGGTVTPSGSPISASKLVLASLFSSFGTSLSNVPRIRFVEDELSLISSLGATYEWVGNDKLKIDTTGVNTHRVPFDVGSKYRTTQLLAGPLLFRFGKAIIPKPINTVRKGGPINRFIETWESLGISVQQDKEWVSLEAPTLQPATINFKHSTHTGTENAILTSLFVPGVTYINNAAEEPEIEDLINFLNSMGAKIERTEPRRIEVTGRTVFKEASYEVQADKNEVVNLAAASIVSKGSITIRNVEKIAIAPFLNILNKVGMNYDFQGDDLAVWHSGKEYSPMNVTSGPAPAVLTDWMPALCVLAMNCTGESTLYDNVYVNPWRYVRDLNSMGAGIKMLTPTEANLPLVIRDDSYDVERFGEPLNVVKIQGPSNLRSSTVDVLDFRTGIALVLSALFADGVTEIRGIDIVEDISQSFMENLKRLGARITTNN